MTTLTIFGSTAAEAAQPKQGDAADRSAQVAARAVPQAAPQLAPFPNRVMTYNLQEPKDKPWTPALHAIDIATYRPQVVALQEACAGHVQEIRRWLKQAFGLDYYVVHSTWSRKIQRCAGFGGYGDAILSAAPMTHVDKQPYANGGSETRGYLAVTTRVDGKPVRVFNTHLAEKQQHAARASEIRELVAASGRGSTPRTIVMGDFNAGPTYSEMAPVWTTKFREADKGCTPKHNFAKCKATADAGPPRAKFDYILLSQDIKPPGNGVHSTQWSDHDIVHADLHVK